MGVIFSRVELIFTAECPQRNVRGNVFGMSGGSVWGFFSGLNFSQKKTNFSRSTVHEACRDVLIWTPMQEQSIHIATDLGHQS